MKDAVSVVSAVTGTVWLRAPPSLHAANAKGFAPIAWASGAPTPLSDPTMTSRANGATSVSGPSVTRAPGGGSPS